MSDTSTLTTLGSKTTHYVYDKPTKELLETFKNQHPDADYIVPFVMPEVEFTSLCPMTGQPDWAKIQIIYIPDKRLVESKSLKLYLGSFRNHGEFHEDCINRILKDLNAVLRPKYIRVLGDFNPRGGLAIKPIAEKMNAQETETIRHLVTYFDSYTNARV